MTKRLKGWSIPKNLSRHHLLIPSPANPAEYRQCQSCGDRNQYVAPCRVGGLAFCQPSCHQARIKIKDVKEVEER